MLSGLCNSDLLVLFWLKWTLAQSSIVCATRAFNCLGSLSPKNCSNQCSTSSVKASDSFCSLLFGTVHYRSLQCRVGALHLIYLTTQLLMFHTLTLSNLLTATINCVTPSDLTSRACSRVWPPASKPDSNSPVLEPTTKIATSALDQTQEHDKSMTSSKISPMTNFTRVFQQLKY